MTDDTTNTPSQSTSDDQNSDGQNKDPLAELEALLAETKASKEAAGTAPVEPTPDPEEIARQQQAAEAEDQKMIAEHRVKMEGIKDTPQYQAGVAARDMEVEADQQTKSDNDGFEIHQVGQTKIDDIK
ncbi:MAG: hypothetical protein WDZ94_01295 [Patescibacteria group bacterium]